MSHHIDNKGKVPCGCGQSSKELAIAIAEYKAMTAEAKKAKEFWEEKAKDFDIQEATSQEVIDMFSGVLTSDGYMHVREGWVDSEGYMHANYRETADNYVTF